MVLMEYDIRRRDVALLIAFHCQEKSAYYLRSEIKSILGKCLAFLEQKSWLASDSESKVVVMLLNTLVPPDRVYLPRPLDKFHKPSKKLSHMLNLQKQVKTKET